MFKKRDCNAISFFICYTFKKELIIQWFEIYLDSRGVDIS